MPPGGSLSIPLEALKQPLSLPNKEPAETSPEGGTNHEKKNRPYSNGFCSLGTWNSLC